MFLTAAVVDAFAAARANPNVGSEKGAWSRRPWFIARAFTESVRSLAV